MLNVIEYQPDIIARRNAIKNLIHFVELINIGHEGGFLFISEHFPEELKGLVEESYGDRIRVCEFLSEGSAVGYRAGSVPE